MKFLGYVFGAKGATIHHEWLYENIYSTYLFQAFAWLVVLSLSYTIYAKFLSPKNKKSDTASLVVPILFTFSLILVWYTKDLDRNDPKVPSYFASGKGESDGKGIDCKITSLKLNGSYSETKPIMFWFNNRKVTKVDRWVPENKYNKKYGFRYTSTADYLNFNQRDNLNNEVCFTLDRKNLQLTGKKLVYNEGKNKYI